MNKRGLLIKCRYYLEVSGYDEKKLIREVVDDHVVVEPKNNDKIGLWGCGFNLFDK